MSDDWTHYSVELGGLEATLVVAPDESESGVAVVEHVLAPGHLGAPRHRHSREDEISRVVHGELTVQQEGDTTTAGPGEAVVKPRDVWHTFWNAGDDPVRFVEIIAPGDFAGFFEAAAPVVSAGPPSDAELARLGELGTEYGVEFDFESVPELLGTYGLDI